MKMDRKPTYAGTSSEKDELDILFWAIHKTPAERVAEAWRLHCLNHNISPQNNRLDKSKATARKR